MSEGYTHSGQNANEIPPIPQAPESERAILGALMLDPATFRSVENLEPSAFFSVAHREIYGAMLALRDRGVEIDPVQVVEELRSRGKLDVAGGAANVASLITGALPSQIGDHVKRVIEAAEKRELQRLGNWVATASTNGTAPAEIVREFLERARAAVDIARGWPEPQPIPDGLRPVPQLSDRLLPEALRPWIADISERMQAPIEFPAVPAIVALASVIGSQICIRPKRRDDWEIISNLWGAVVGRPGAMKSPAIEQALRPLRRLVAEAAKAFEGEMSEFAFEAEKAKARKDAARDNLKKAAKKGEDLDAYKDELSGTGLTMPTERRYIVNDSTVEKYGELLNENPTGLLIFRDELTGWLRSLDDERRANDRAFYLEAWGGAGSYVYDRIGRGTLKIENITTSIIGGIQPGRLESYLRGAMSGGADDDGLIQRFQLLVYPDLPAEWRLVDQWPDTAAKDTAFAVFKQLAKIEWTGDSDKKFLRFDDQAQDFFDEWLTDNARTLRSGEIEHPAMEAHLSKYRSLIPSLALIFELAERAAARNGELTVSGADTVGLPAVKMAAAWGSFLWAHAQRTYGLAINAAANQARTIARKLQAGALEDGFKARDVWRHGWSGISSPEAVRDPLDVLESLGWVRSIEIRNPAGERGGRPTVQYSINPRIKEIRL